MEVNLKIQAFMVVDCVINHELLNHFVETQNAVRDICTPQNDRINKSLNFFLKDLSQLIKADMIRKEPEVFNSQNLLVEMTADYPSDKITVDISIHGANYTVDWDDDDKISFETPADKFKSLYNDLSRTSGLFTSCLGHCTNWDNGYLISPYKSKVLDLKVLC